MNPNVKRVKDTVETGELGEHLDIVSYIHVWSNGKVIRRFQGQDKENRWRNPKDGYRKMVAILVEVQDENDGMENENA